jgi:hypothetical protein
MSEERYYMASMHDFMSDVTVRDEASASSQSQNAWSAEGGASGWTIGFAGGGSVNAKGSHNASSTSEFLRELHSHAEMSDRRSVTMTRAASSAQVGEVQTRTHIESESEDHFESSSRTFSNPNRCHALTFYFYQINKTQTVKFTIESIERRVIDPAAETGVTNNPPKLTGAISVIPDAVRATDKERLEVEAIGRRSVANQQGEAAGSARLAAISSSEFAAIRAPAVDPLPTAVRRQALLQVDQDLVAAGLLDKVGAEGVVSPEVQKRFSFERCSSLPTPGLFVRGCLDDCNICEPTLMREIELELARKELENKLLERQIELLEKSQEYRCCPHDEHEPDA